jgi:hypothetical protein
MLITVEGVYRNGKIELAETPREVSEGTLVAVLMNYRQQTCVRAWPPSPKSGKALR